MTVSHTYNILILTRSCVTNFRPEDVQSIITGKLALKYAGAQVEAMQFIAKASQDRSVAEFEKVRMRVR